MAERAGMAVAFWRRLDAPGADAARLALTPSGWRLEGTAVFVHEDKPAKLSYEIELNADWSTRHGLVRGFIGRSREEHTIARDALGWIMDGSRINGLEHLVDLDLGFTPATNLQHLRRVNLAVGEEADIPVAWLAPGASTLVELPQSYRRDGEHSYWYRAPSVSYETRLELAANGFAKIYPPLWVLEAD